MVNLTSFVDAVSTLCYSILLHRTILSPVTYPMASAPPYFRGGPGNFRGKKTGGDLEQFEILGGPKNKGGPKI